MAQARTAGNQIRSGQKRPYRPDPHFDFYDREASRSAAHEVAGHFAAALSGAVDSQRRTAEMR